MISFKRLFLLSLITLSFGCNRHTFVTGWAKETCPPAYNVRFETTKGKFEIHVERKFSPYAADRFYQLVKHKYLNNTLFYRVVPDFVAQFGISDTVAMKHWIENKVPDEDVKYSNKKGTISFARSSAETRGYDLFINLKDNQRLDTVFSNSVRGFPAFGNVTKGMEVVSSLYSGYSNSTMDTLDILYENRKKFLQIFPRLDKIQKAYMVH